MHAFSICAIAQEKTPPPPPHSASYNIAATATCASRVSALVGHRKRPPPVQVTVATTTCASRVSVLVDHRKRPPPVQITVATTTCVSRVSALVGHRKRQPVQVTVAPGQHNAPFAPVPPHVPESKCAQWLKKKTTSARMRVHGKKFNGMPLGKLYLLAAVCTPMVVVQVLTGCILYWHRWWWL